MWTTLDILYNQVLSQAITTKAPASRINELQNILGAIVVAMDPLPTSSLETLLGFNLSPYIAPGAIVRE